MLVEVLEFGEPALTVANPIRFLLLKMRIYHFFFMLGNWRGARAVARGRFTPETEGRWMFCHGPRRLGRCAVGGKFEGNRVLEQVGSRGGQEEVLEFSKRTAAQVKDILAQGQVFLRTITWRCVHDERSVFEDTELRP